MYSSTERELAAMKLMIKVKSRLRRKDLANFAFAQPSMKDVADDFLGSSSAS